MMGGLTLSLCPKRRGWPLPVGRGKEDMPAREAACDA